MEPKDLNTLLKERKLSQAKMSRDLGLTTKTFGDWISEKKDARLRNVARCCEYLNVSFRVFAASIGVDVSRIPLDAEVSSIPSFVALARSQKIPLKQLAASFGIDVTGVPDDK